MKRLPLSEKLTIDRVVAVAVRNAFIENGENYFRKAFEWLENDAIDYLVNNKTVGSDYDNTQNPTELQEARWNHAQMAIREIFQESKKVLTGENLVAKRAKRR